MKKDEFLFEGRKFKKSEIQKIYRTGYVLFIQMKHKKDIGIFYETVKDAELGEDYIKDKLGRPNKWMQSKK